MSPLWSRPSPRSWRIIATTKGPGGGGEAGGSGGSGEAGDAGGSGGGRWRGRPRPSHHTSGISGTSDIFRARPRAASPHPPENPALRSEAEGGLATTSCLAPFPELLVIIISHDLGNGLDHGGDIRQISRHDHGVVLLGEFAEFGDILFCEFQIHGILSEGRG